MLIYNSSASPPFLPASPELCRRGGGRTGATQPPPHRTDCLPLLLAAARCSRHSSSICCSASPPTRVSAAWPACRLPSGYVPPACAAVGSRAVLGVAPSLIWFRCVLAGRLSICFVVVRVLFPPVAVVSPPFARFGVPLLLSRGRFAPFISLVFCWICCPLFSVARRFRFAALPRLVTSFYPAHLLAVPFPALHPGKVSTSIASVAVWHSGIFFLFLLLQ